MAGLASVNHTLTFKRQLCHQAIRLLSEVMQPMESRIGDYNGSSKMCLSTWRFFW